MPDKATVLTTTFTIVDDTMKGSAVIQHALDRPGPAPSLVFQWAGHHRPRSGTDRWTPRGSLLPTASIQSQTFFPGLKERSRYNRRKRDLWSVILAVRVSLQIVLEAAHAGRDGSDWLGSCALCWVQTGKHASDFVGTADYGVFSSKAMKYFGCTFYRVVSLTGIIMGFLLTPASRYDNQPVVELLDLFSHHLKRLLGNGASNDAALESYLEQYRSVELLAPAKVNQPPKRSQQAQRQLNRLRLICETVNAQLQEQLHLSKHYAKSTWGVMTRIAAKVTVHSMSMMVNPPLGRPVLKLADLAV